MVGRIDPPDARPIAAPLAAWQPVHAAAVRLDAAGHLVFHDTAQNDYHLIRISDPAFEAARLRLTVTLRPTAACNVEFHVNHWGSVDVCRISRFGDIIDPGISEELDVAVDPAGRLIVTVAFFNTHPTVSLGTSHGPGGRYLGRAQDQFVFEQISLVVERPEELAEEDRICVVDVGAAGGLQGGWRARRNMIRPIAFEPNPTDAAAIRAELESINGGMVIEQGLFSQDGERTLHITRLAGCSSVLRPNAALLARYAIAPAFDVVEERPIRCVRYDTLHRSGDVPQPDVIKIDVQGAELDVLHGFGGLLASCLAIELETHLYPIYQGQALLGDIVAYLDRFGFSLRKLEPQMSFDADAVEYNAYFTKRPDQLPHPAGRARTKLATVERVWQVTTSPAGGQLAAMALNG
ncbi:MAG: FkbM family methyltransferase [Rhodospirillales bacterium]|nr:FkbM family methyltransferase [Rhodospirillales bacterium]